MEYKTMPVRKNPRILGHDYEEAATYMITTCTKNMRLLFGRCIINGMLLNPAGNIVRKSWKRLPEIFPDVEVDAFFVVMPNHFHGIIRVEDGTRLGTVVGTFKSMSARLIRQADPSVGEVWQRNYFDNIIRSDKALYRLREYIANNPTQWRVDELNPCFARHDRRPRWERNSSRL